MRALVELSSLGFANEVLGLCGGSKLRDAQLGVG
jgi:hypothetical protein